MSTEDRVKLFAMSTRMLERDLDAVESRHALDLGRADSSSEARDQEFYPQFDEVVRREAAAMGLHYELFYCLERSIRGMIQDRLEAEHGASWWDEAVPEDVKTEAKKNIKREVDSGVTRRSTEEIDFTTFGQLGEIVRHNWDVFGDTFSSQKAFTSVMTSLNVLRGPIAHSCPLAEDEVVRLRLTVQDWFRLMA